MDAPNIEQIPVDARPSRPSWRDRPDGAGVADIYNCIAVDKEIGKHQQYKAEIEILDLF